MHINTVPEPSRRQLSSLTHDEVLKWLTNEGLKVYAHHFEKLKMNAWYLGMPVNGKTLVEVCGSNVCESLLEDGKFFKVRGAEQKIATRLQRKKFVRVLQSALRNGIPTGKLMKSYR